MSDIEYEAVGLTKEEAIEVGEILCGGSFYFVNGHAWPSENTVIRPVGCQCGHCKEFNANSNKSPEGLL